MKVYQEADDDVEKLIQRLVKAHHPDLVKAHHPDLVKAGVTVAAVFVVDSDDPEKPVVMHHGSPALAVIGAVPAKYRALDCPDAVIEIDRTRYQKATPKRRESLIAHELHHLVAHTGAMDGADRPKLKMRKHDRQFGWFDAIAKRYGEDAWEVIQARQIVSEAGQIYFGFAQTGGEVVPITREDLKQAGASK